MTSERRTERFVLSRSLTHSIILLLLLKQHLPLRAVSRVNIACVQCGHPLQHHPEVQTLRAEHVIVVYVAVRPSDVTQPHSCLNMVNLNPEGSFTF